MSSIPFVAGYTPQAWYDATDVMIPKKADSIAVEQLRIIILYHALFNQANKAIGRALLHHAEQFSQIPPEAYGSRRNHRAIECALNKVLTADIWRQSRRTGALCSNDAKSCYDRIVHSVAILAMRRLGLSPETCHVMIGTLDQVRHHVRTAYGDSASSYGGIEIPLQGIGQGNGAGPAIWLVVSIAIINMLKAEGFGFQMRTPISHEEFDFVCYTFVDDTDLVHSPSPPLPWDQLCEEMQSVLDHWDGGLHASGGALVPQKSHWYLVSFAWKNDKWVYNTINETPGGLYIYDQHRQRVPLNRLEVGDACETLGICMSMDGNQQAEFLKLRSIAQKWADQVRCGRLAPSEAWFSLNHTVMRALEYPLMATSLSKSQCDTIMTVLLQAALPKLHIAMSFPKTVRFGPRKYHGLGIPHLWTTQGIEKIYAILRHGTLPSIPGQQLRCSYELTLLETGLPGNLFTHPYSIFRPLTTPGWITSLWEFVDTSHIQVDDPFPAIPLQCHDDQFLMLAFAYHKLAPATLRQANICRLWLRVLRLSDIISGDGRRILDQYWYGTGPNSTTSMYDWPPVGEPSPSAWRAWRTLLSQLAPGPTRSLTRPLGAWHVIPPSSHAWFFSAQENRLFQILSDSSAIKIYIPTHHRSSRRPRFQFLHESPDPLPTDASRTCIYSCGPLHIQHTGTRPTQIIIIII